MLGQPPSIDEALYQIVRNAFQFSPAGAPVRISARIESGVAWLVIEDAGPGAPADLADRVFEPFFTTLPPGGGLGLGLTVAYGIVRQHGGQIRFDSRPGKGTSVSVGLPLWTGSERAGGLVQAKDEPSGGRSNASCDES